MDSNTMDTTLNSSRYVLLKQAFIDSLPLLAAYFPLGVVWGVLWEQVGLPSFWGVLFSAGVYGATAQFIALSLLAADASLWELLITVIPVALRNSFYTIAASQRMPSKRLHRLYAAFGQVDTTFAILMGKPAEQAKNPQYNISLNLLVQVYWVAGTAVGIYSGGHIPNGIASLNFVLPALLTSLALEQYRKLNSWKPVAIALLAASTMYLLLGRIWLVPALIICMAATIMEPNEESVQ